ncbi:MAG: sulfotransferase domain-containing protein [Anaerolineales bacterium]
MCARYHHIVSIHGVPRSGTSWLGKIFSSHSNVAYRFQPLFSYRFKNRISLDSNEHDVQTFLHELYDVKDDDFILGNWLKVEEPDMPVLQKEDFPSVMVMKEVRYHHLIEKLLNSEHELQVIGIVRNPCAVISSWFQAPREFKKEWDPLNEWRFAQSKNQGSIEEFYGFEKWKEVASLFLDLQVRYPERFLLIQYEHLVEDPVNIISNVFSFVELKMEKQVTAFIKASQSVHVDDAYAVHKDPSVKSRWQLQLDPRIAREIIEELRGTNLERFLI